MAQRPTCPLPRLWNALDTCITLTRKLTNNTQHPNGGRVQSQVATIINNPHGSHRGLRIGGRRVYFMFFIVIISKLFLPPFYLGFFIGTFVTGWRGVSLTPATKLCIPPAEKRQEPDDSNDGSVSNHFYDFCTHTMGQCGFNARCPFLKH